MAGRCEAGLRHEAGGMDRGFGTGEDGRKGGLRGRRRDGCLLEVVLVRNLLLRRRGRVYGRFGLGLGWRGR